MNLVVSLVGVVSVLSDAFCDTRVRKSQELVWEEKPKRPTIEVRVQK